MRNWIGLLLCLFLINCTIKNISEKNKTLVMSGTIYYKSEPVQIEEIAKEIIVPLESEILIYDDTLLITNIRTNMYGEFYEELELLQKDKQYILKIRALKNSKAYYSNFLKEAHFNLICIGNEMKETKIYFSRETTRFVDTINCKYFYGKDTLIWED